jgi:Domain of unknown function (DUF4129)
VGTQPEQPSRGPLSAARTAALAGSLVALLVVVSVAARSGDHGRAMPGGSLASAAGHHAAVWVLLVIGPIAGVLGLGVFLYSQVVRRRDPALAVMRRKARRRLLVFVAIAIALEIYYLRTGHNPLSFLHIRNPLANVSPPPPAKGHPHAAAPGNGFATVDWAIAGVTWLLIVAAVIVVYRRMRRTEELEDGAAPLELEDDPPDTRLARLRAEKDPRRAVIGAYALMDGLMADRALGRRRSEAPVEYLGRMTLAGYGRITALGRLTRLYARARFSTHPIDAGMQAEAVDAVEAIAAEGPAE